MKTPPTAYDSRVSEFESSEQANAYTQWLRNEIDSRLNDGFVGVPHDQVMSGVSILLESYDTLKAA
jgi:hypothetical protein